MNNLTKEQEIKRNNLIRMQMELVVGLLPKELGLRVEQSENSYSGPSIYWEEKGREKCRVDFDPFTPSRGRFGKGNQDNIRIRVSDYDFGIKVKWFVVVFDKDFTSMKWNAEKFVERFNEVVAEIRTKESANLQKRDNKLEVIYKLGAVLGTPSSFYGQDLVWKKGAHLALGEVTYNIDTKQLCMSYDATPDQAVEILKGLLSK